MPLPPVCLLGGRTRTPFAGHFRGVARSPAGVELAWAGALHGTAGVEEGWLAAQAARAALAGLDVRWHTIEAALASGQRALAELPARWLSRQDLTALFVARAEGRAVAMAAGLAEAWACPSGRWGPISGLASEAGEWTLPAVVPGDRWVGVPPGTRFSSSNLDITCGVRG